MLWPLGAAGRPGSRERPRKAMNVLLDAGPGGVVGGMNNRKYISITVASRATAARDLGELSEMGLLAQVGAGRSVRYYPNLRGWIPEETEAHPASAVRERPRS